MVSWGADTVHTFDKGSAAATTVAAAATTPQLLSSSTSAGTTFPSFGFPPGAPAAGAGGIGIGATSTASSFPAATAAAPPQIAAGGTGSSTFAFGTPAPAAPPPPPPPFSALGGGGGMFGSTPAPSGGGIFGGGSASTTTSAGIFGSSSAGPLFGGFGQQQSQQPSQAQAAMLVPAQAALQAHQNAEARQEEARVVSALSAIHRAYSGTAVCGDGDDYAPSSSSAPFTLIYYTDISPELRQQQWLQGMIVGGAGAGGENGGASAHAMVRPVVPPRPWQVSGRDWRSAAARNPDPAARMPAVLLGASALQSRIAYQQESASKLTGQFRLVRDAVDAIRQQSQQLRLQVADRVRHRHNQQRSRLLAVMRKVELVRSFQIPIQNGELQAMERLANLYRDLERTVQPTVRLLHDQAQQQRQQNPPSSAGRGRRGGGSSSSSSTLAPDQAAELENILKNEHGPGIARLQEALEKPVRDVALLKKRVERAPLPALLPPPPMASLRR